MRNFLTLSKMRSGSSTVARPKGTKKRPFQKPPARPIDAMAVASKNRLSPAKLRSKKVKKLANGNSGRSDKFKQPRAKAAGVPGTSCAPHRGPFHVRALRAHRRVAQRGQSQMDGGRSHDPSVEKPAAALNDVIAKSLEIIDQVMIETQQLAQKPTEVSSQGDASTQPAPIEPAFEVICPPAQSIEIADAAKRQDWFAGSAQSSAPVIDVTDAMPAKEAQPDQVRITAPQLELAIAEATKMAGPSCAEFVGVVVRHVKPKSPVDPNWALRGVKFGRSDRAAVNEALTTILERMQREFRLSDE
ncbi:hypothetical protein [Bradyrhizobium archetypum]|uniref:Uncharacterized protein n=1 Tax=Bradyrhizobium archetypum TaxID=2721160 RepID=A0A7Y4H4Z2_9BRAD|nr:hypothetical protein [Bradyrhizobium archetypum]NOJ47705.1 hypothetical protein [Bradyrhizobium archetypum]